MNDPQELLHERLMRLDAGETLDAVAAGLPEEEAGLLRVAASLQALGRAERSTEIAAAQRAQLVRAARASAGPSASGLERLRARLPSLEGRWTLPAAFASGFAALVLCALVMYALAGVAWLRRASAPSVVRDATAQPVAVASAPAVVAAPDPQSAVVHNVRGVVEIQGSDGAWRAAKAGALVRAGERVRTGFLSSATLEFFDGSQARLGPDSELSVDSLDAQKSGPRVVLLSQPRGESDHDVAPSSDPASRYEVSTPSGTGTAKGTSFHVLVTAVLVRFNVDEGAVAVTNLSVTVTVIAGQSTTINFGEAPQEPVFRISGEGTVEAIGDRWRIAGQTFVVHDDTVIVGAPEVGDWVRVEGRLLADGTRVADLIVLLHRRLENRFSFTGEVQAIGESAWTIGGRVVRVDELTTIEAGLAVGDLVEVQGGIAADGALWASTIRRVVASGFQFTGVVQSIGPEAWVISGISVTVNLSTTIQAGIVVSDVVRVAGQILEDGTWLAATIERAAAGTFDFVGVVITKDPWVVGGVALETDANTVIDEGIAIGNRVRVTGRILADGRWLAERIIQLDEGKRHHVEFTGRVHSIDPWVVGGVTVTVDAKTKLIGDIQVGDLVRVKGNLLPDGTVVANKIEKVRQARGCFDIRAIVQTVSTGQIVLLGGQALPLGADTQVQGNLQVAAVVIVHACVGEEGELTILSVIVIFQLDGLPPLPPPVAVGCPGVQVIVISGGQIFLPGGTFVQLDGGTWIQVEVSRKGDKAKIKINGDEDAIEIKVKSKGKRSEIEIEAEDEDGFSLVGGGKFDTSAVVVILACAGENGLVFSVSSGGQPEGQGAVTICHRPPGNPGNARTLRVEPSAVQGHLNHGDTLGACGDSDSDHDDDEDEDDDEDDDD